MVSLNRKVILAVAMSAQSLFLTTPYATEKVLVTDIDREKLSAYYEGAAHTLQFSSRLMATMNLMNNPKARTLAFQSLFLAAGTEANNRVIDTTKGTGKAYKKGIVETTQLWTTGNYTVCLPMDKTLSAFDIEAAINKAFKGPFKQESLTLLIVGAMEQLSIQYPCK